MFKTPICQISVPQIHELETMMSKDEEVDFAKLVRVSPLEHKSMQA
jgi:hypothetical protein